MGYAIILLFDSETEEKLQAIQRRLKAEGLPAFLSDNGVKPHISLGGYSDLDTNTAVDLLKNFCANERRFSVYLCFIGSFLSKEKVIFTAPALTDELRGIHLRFHNRFHTFENTSSQLYRPGAWQPHCTLGMELSDSDFINTFKLIADNMMPLEAHIESIGLVKYFPIETLAEFRLQQ